MKESEKRAIPNSNGEWDKEVPDWKAFPEQERQEVVMILAGMLLNCRPRGKEGDDESES